MSAPGELFGMPFGLTPEARAELGIFDNTIRLSVGLEDAGDLEADLDQSLAAAKG